MNEEQLKWVDDVWNKIVQKLDIITHKNNVMFPYTLDKKGTFVEKKTNEVSFSWWTNGFWPGILWLMFKNTKSEIYQKLAENVENALDEALIHFDGLHHDVGFMWMISSVANYRLTGNETSRRRGMLAASLLASRYNCEGEFIRAWNGKKTEGWAIIDSMMNISILYWATEITGDSRFSYIAQKHAKKIEKYFIRPDGSVNHIVCFDTQTGDYIDTFGGQGYEKGSSWTRGQAWAIYGFVLSYIHTNEQFYLNVAKKVAHYFISNLNTSFVPDCDFRSPKTPVYKDTTAGVIAACGLIEISKAVKEQEKELYLNTAINILKETEKKYCDWTTGKDAIVMMGTESYKGTHNIPIIYGDYYFIEAIDKLKYDNILFW